MGIISKKIKEAWVLQRQVNKRLTPNLMGTMEVSLISKYGKTRLSFMVVSCFLEYKRVRRFLNQHGFQEAQGSDKI